MRIFKSDPSLIDIGKECMYPDPISDGIDSCRWLSCISQNHRYLLLWHYGDCLAQV
jgi:hypothetical protein